jgi:hypothetical protein
MEWKRVLPLPKVEFDPIHVDRKRMRTCRILFPEAIAENTRK